MLVRRAIAKGVPPNQFLEVAGVHLADPDAIVRYEAGIVVSEAIAADSETGELAVAAAPWQLAGLLSFISGSSSFSDTLFVDGLLRQNGSI